MRHRFLTLALSGTLLTGTLALVSQTTPLKAQDLCAAQPDALALRQAISLADAMPEQRDADLRPRIFYQKSIELVYQPGQTVLLAGSPQGLRTDDLVRIDAAPSGLYWEHDFRDAARTRIDPLNEKPDLSGLLVEGSNQITLTLTDLIGPAWSTSNYTLEIWDSCQKPADPTVTEAAPADPPTAEVLAATETITAIQSVAPDDASPLENAAVQAGSSEMPIMATLIPAEVFAALLGENLATPVGEPTPERTALLMPTATPAVKAVQAATLPTPVRTVAGLQETLPTPDVAVIIPVNEVPAGSAPVPSPHRLWRLFFGLALLTAVWWRYRYGNAWREPLADLRVRADELMVLARYRMLALWQQHGAKPYAELVRVVVENTDSKRR